MTGKSNKLHMFFLALIAFIWGVSFVAQREGGNAIGPYSFCFIRTLMGAAVIYPVILLNDRRSGGRKATAEDKKLLWKGGVFCGIFFSMVMLFQQLGVFLGTPVGKAGFLTSCYVIIVPILGLFIGKKCRWNVWVAVVITLCGLYLLCITESFGISRSDTMVLIASFMNSLHILTIDRYTDKVDVLRLSCYQMLVAAVIFFFPTVIIDMQHSAAGFMLWAEQLKSLDAWISILYAGILASGIAVTLQNVGQRDVHPTNVSLLLSLEAVFSVLAGWVLLHQALSTKELIGCALVFVAIVLAQITFPSRKGIARNV